MYLSFILIHNFSATCRRPIKWAAMHPMQRKYPDTPVSPRTWEKQEIDRRLVPIHVQIFFFLAVMCLLYLSYTWAQDDSLSPFVALLDSLDLGSNDEQGLFLQAEAQDVFRMRVMFFFCLLCLMSYVFSITFHFLPGFTFLKTIFNVQLKTVMCKYC